MSTEADRYIALQVIMMPRDANPSLTPVPGHPQNALYMTIFGGILLSYIDQAGAVGGRREVALAGGAIPHLVTVAVNRVEFKKPVLVGDVVRFLTQPIRIGKTSITMHVAVEAERAGEVLQVTEAELVYVGVDLSTPERRPRVLLGDKA